MDERVVKREANASLLKRTDVQCHWDVATCLFMTKRSLDFVYFVNGFLTLCSLNKCTLSRLNCTTFNLTSVSEVYLHVCSFNK